MPYLALAKTCRAIEETRSRLKIVDILSNYFRSVLVLTSEDLVPSIYLCLNKLGPAYEGQELGIAETYLTKASADLAVLFYIFLVTRFGILLLRCGLLAKSAVVGHQIG